MDIEQVVYTHGKPLRLDRLRTFVSDFSALLSQASAEAQILEDGGQLLANLVRHDDWLPAAFAMPHRDRYQQYLLHCDSGARFSVVAFVWAPGQATPIHDHTVWGLIGILRGSELAQSYVRPDNVPIANGPPRQFWPGEIDSLSPTLGDIHQVSNALTDQASISIHVYGGDIGSVQRSVFVPDGGVKRFVSGYANDVLPNMWGIDRE